MIVVSRITITINVYRARVHSFKFYNAHVQNRLSAKYAVKKKNN